MKWIKASDRLPEDKRNLDGSPILIIVRWIGLGHAVRLRTATPNQCADFYKTEMFEWLDESEPTSPSAPSNDYWKKRCEAAEELIDDNLSPNDYSQWQQLKSNPPKEGD